MPSLRKARGLFVSWSSSFGGKVGGGAWRVAGVLYPAAAERAIEIDEVGEPLLLRRHQRELRVVVAGLRGEHLEIAVDAVAIAELRKLEAALLRRRIALLRGELLVERAACGEPVGDFAERGLDRLLVLRDADVLADGRDIEVGAQRAALEDRRHELRHEGPGERAGAEQAGQCGALGADARGETDIGEERGARGADIGVLRAQQCFGLEDVRPLYEEVRRQAGRNVGEDLLLAERRPRRQIRGHWLSKQEHQSVLGLSPRTRLRGV